MSEWINAEEYCVSVFDGTHDTPKVAETGYKLVTSKNILSNTLDLNSAYFISEEDFVNINKRSKVKQYDILFSMIGTVGSLYFETSDTIDYAIKNIGVFSSGDKEKAEWLYYYLQSSYAQQYIKRYLNGAVQKFLPLKGLREFPVPQFNKELHNRIKILLNIDKKIKINNQINQELEAMAKTLYDYWFVQFDFPDQNGKPYKSSGGKMLYHPELKREIPEGWGVEKLGDMAQFKNGINYEKTSSGSEKVKIINVRNISSSTIFINQTDLDEIFLENDKSTNFIVNEGMILITRSGIPGATRLVSELEAKTVYSGFIIASEVNDLINKNLIFYYLKNVEEVLKNQSAGTIMKNISQSVLTDMTVSLPPQNVLLKFNSIIDNLLEQMKNVQRQNQELTQLRDWLLPMLMNGQAKVE